jgi:hypothetical protein
MYFQEILEVAIGLIFVWLVLSLTMMQVQEWLAGILKWRSNNLENAIMGMIQDPELLKEFYSHPLIVGLTDPDKRKENFWQKRSQRLPKPTPRPSYIPTEKFATVMLEIVLSAGTDTSRIQNALEHLKQAEGSPVDDLLRLAQQADFRTIQSTIENLKEVITATIEKNPTIATELKEALYYVDESQSSLNTVRKMIYALKDNPDIDIEMVEALNGLLAHVASASDIMRALPRLQQELETFLSENPIFKPHLEQFSNELKNSIFEQIRRGAERFPGATQVLNSLATQAETLLTEADNQIGNALKHVETWFDDTMDRLTGWYKRDRQKLGFWIALLIALIFNVDTIDIGLELWRQPALRQAVISQAEKFELPPEDRDEVKELKVIINDLTETMDGLNIPIGWQWEPVNYGKSIDNCKLNPNPNLKDEVLGYRFLGTCSVWVNPPGNSIEFAYKIMGVTVSALAAMQGAPYWFDILKKLVNVRSSGVNPDEKKEKKK